MEGCIIIMIFKKINRLENQFLVEDNEAYLMTNSKNNSKMYTFKWVTAAWNIQVLKTILNIIIFLLKTAQEPKKKSYRKQP